MFVNPGVPTTPMLCPRPSSTVFISITKAVICYNVKTNVTRYVDAFHPSPVATRNPKMRTNKWQGVSEFSGIVSSLGHRSLNGEILLKIPSWDSLRSPRKCNPKKRQALDSPWELKSASGEVLSKDKNEWDGNNLPFKGDPWNE